MNLEAYLPEFPRTYHLPIEPNATSDDKVASPVEMERFLAGKIHVEEKVDGSNCGVTLIEGQIVVRSRSNILNTDRSGRGGNARAQFAPIWSYFYDRVDRFELLEEQLGFMPGVYGEWIYAAHKIP